VSMHNLKDGIDPRTRLSDHFVLRELTRSRVAEKHQLYNVPREESELANLKALAEQVLEPARRYLGVPLIITSGYRCGTLNRLIGGAVQSQHMFGEAADFVPRGVPVADAALTLAALDDLPFDQLIYEVRDREGTDPQEWIHISHKRVAENRREILTIHRPIEGAQTVVSGIHVPEVSVGDAA